MGWKIKFNYDTGDTFGTYPGREGFVRAVDTDYETHPDGYEWDNKEVAREALGRLKEHYLWQDSLSTTYGEDLPQPKWWEKDTKHDYGFDWHFNVTGNDGEEIFLYSGTYLGYFETLNYAELVSTEDPDRVEFRKYP
jgi:hypothetical protein